MSNEDDFWIPRNLDAPALMFMWEADSAILVILFLILGGVLQMPILGFFLAIVVGKAYQYLKEEGGKGLIVKILYWYTPSDLWLSKRYASHIREYIGG